MTPWSGRLLKGGTLFCFLTIALGLFTMRAESALPFAFSYGFLSSTANAAAWGNHHDNHGDNIRMNQIQVVGTHNSYHREISLAERTVFEKYVPAPQNYYYSHSQFADQLDHQQARSFEIDLHSDTQGGLYAHPLIWQLSNLTNETVPWHDDNMLRPGLKVFHITDVDTNAICHTFVECLTQLKDWSDAHPRHLPITVDLELKNDALGCALGGVCADEARNWTLDRILEVDREIRSVLPATQLIVPDDLRPDANLTLEQSVLRNGWPRLRDARGRFLFYFDNDPADTTIAARQQYTAAGHESLQGRVVFTNAVEGAPDCAVVKLNDPQANATDIARLVRKGYLVRTRADEPVVTVLSGNYTRRALAFASGAQIVSSDFPAYGMSARWARDYAVQLDGGRVARCNPVNAPEWCRDEMVQ